MIYFAVTGFFLASISLVVIAFETKNSENSFMIYFLGIAIGNLFYIGFNFLENILIALQSTVSDIT